MRNISLESVSEQEPELFIEEYVKPSDSSYRFCRAVLKPIALFLYRPKIIGAENIPSDGAVLIAGNHPSILDPAFVCLSTKRTVRYLAKKELLEGKFRWFFRAAQCIPVDRSHKDHNATSAALTVLKHGEVIGIMPEGKTNRTKEKLLPLRYGTVSMAQKTGAQIVPFAVFGSYIPFRGDMKIIFGEPFAVHAEDDLPTANQYLRERILELMER